MIRIHRQQRWTLILITVAALFALAAFAALATAGELSGHQSKLVRYNGRPTVTPNAGASTTPAGALAGILARVNSPALVTATLGGPPSWAHESDEPATPNSPGFVHSLWLNIDVKAVAATPEATTKPIWLGNLITGALRDELYGAALKPLRSSVVNVLLSDGSRIDSAGGGIGAVTPGQNFTSASDSQIKQQIGAAASAGGFTVQSLDVIHADQPAPAVVLTTSDPQKAAADPDAVTTEVFGPPGTYEGEYLEVRTTDGTLVLVQGSSFRTGVGQRWVNPDFGGTNDAPASAK